MNISCSKGTDSNLETSGILQSYGIQYIQIKYLQATAANSRFVLALGSHLSMPIPIMERDPATLAGKQMRGHGQAHPQDSTLVSLTVHQQKVPAGQGGCIFSHIMPGSSNCRRFLDSYLAWSGFTCFPSLEELYYSFHLSTLWFSFLRMPKWNHMYVYIELFKMSWNLQTFWRLNLAPRASNSVHCWDLPRNINSHYRMHTKVKPRYVCVRMRCASTWLSYPFCNFCI